MYRILFIFALFVSFGVSASFCPYSSTLLNSMSVQSQLMLYKSCAESLNDDASQVKLAELYDKGGAGVTQDLKKALYYYQLSADNGNAESQTRLAQIYMEADKTREGRQQVRGYLDEIVYVPFSDSEEKDFDGSLVHPYVLLMLANEKPENKWYYPTKVVQAPANAKSLFNSFNLNDKQIHNFKRQASAWKKRKLLEIARQILSKEEYQTFVETLYPTKGKADAFRRSQLLKEFQEKVKVRKQQDLENAQTLY